MTPFVVLDEIDSTNAEARRRAEADESGPLWIAARRQTAGRGRYGRRWESGDNLAATLLTTTDRPPVEAAQMSFVAALAVAELARGFVPPSVVALKWPNDVLLDGAKTSGILVESGATGAAGQLWLAVGIGVNLASYPEGPERPATCLGAHLRADVSDPPSFDAALRGLIAAFERWQGVWDREGFAPIRAAWTEAASGLGEAAVARLGNETVHGTAEGLDDDGALRMRLGDGSLRRITAGDVFFG